MQRLRIIKKWGNSFAILLPKSDIEDFDFKEGDRVDISKLEKERVEECKD